MIDFFFSLFALFCAACRSVVLVKCLYTAAMDASSSDNGSWHGEEDLLREYIERKYRESQSVAFFADAPPSFSLHSSAAEAAARDAGAEWKEAYDMFRKENVTVADTLAATAQQTEENVCGPFLVFLCVCVLTCLCDSCMFV